MVFQGNLCQRQTQNNVDINRNFDVAWTYVTLFNYYNVLYFIFPLFKKVKNDYHQISSGSQPFSEPESRAIRDAIQSINPDVFFSVHSGMEAILTPFAFTYDKLPKHYSELYKITDDAADQSC